ncbi:AMP-binding protein [Streptomyces venezuelae]|uniref:AMP-binding protein n=1 Tax=Streptomyces venezuelae TaxID=54571 RepID=UPI00278C6B99|nr:AMP-binding protein [Streptomyces venezuelae]
MVDAATSRARSVAEFRVGVAHAAGRLRECGVGAGDVVAVTVPLGEAFLHVVFACFAVGAAPALLDPAAETGVVGATVGEMRPRLWVTVDGDEEGATAAHQLWDPDSVACGEMVLEPVEMEPADPCMVIHTSGTTGVPKGVPWSCELVRSQMELMRAADAERELRTEFVTLSWVALWAVGLGRCVVLPDAGPAGPARMDVAAVVGQMHAHGCDYTFASMALWRRIVAHCRTTGTPMPPVKAGATSGAPANLRALAELVDALPHTRLDVLYASTEAPPPMAVLDARRLVAATDAVARHARGIPVGQPMPDTRIAVIDPNTATTLLDDSVTMPPGRPGEVIVSGPRVTTEYLGRPDLTRAAKLRHRDGTLWHRMGDIGYLDEDGMLWFLSRKKHVIPTPDGPVYPDQHEHVYAFRTGAYQCVLTRPQPADHGHSADGLFLVLPDGAPRVGQADLDAIARDAGLPAPTLLRYPGPFPVDSRHHSKIDRAAVTAWTTDAIRASTAV